MNACLALNACTKKGQPFRATLGALLSGEFHGLAENIHAKHPTDVDIITRKTKITRPTNATSSPTPVPVPRIIISSSPGHLRQSRGQPRR